MKKAVSMVLLLVICIGLFVGCGGDDNTTDNSVASSTGGPVVSDGIFSTEKVVFIDENGDSVYRIIRPLNGSLDETTVAGVVFKQVKNKLNVQIRNASDEEDGTDVYEILIGGTNRSESAQALEYMIATGGGRIDDFIVCTIGKKIVINAMTAEALNKACDWFINNYVSSSGVDGGIKYINLTSGDYANTTVNGVALGNFKVVRKRFNQSYLVQSEIEKGITSVTAKAGYVLKTVEDNNAASDYEIIVGNAARDGVTAVDNADEYRITVSGNKVYINGGSTYATAIAVSEFMNKAAGGTAFTDSSSVVGSYAQTVASYDMSNYYAPKWMEDFDTPSSEHETGVDLTKWNWGTDRSEGQNGRTSVRSQSAAHLRVENGMLNFYAAYDADNYYGFKLMTNETMTFRYGILEMSAILPHGDAFWISLWANSKDPTSDAAFMTEVNIVEMFGNSASEASNLHGWLKSNKHDYYESYWKPQGIDTHWSLDATHSSNKRYALPDGCKFNDELHTFSYVWSNDICGFACDGNMYFSIDPSEKELWAETFNQPIYLILSQATAFATGSGKNLPDDSPEWYESNNFQIDYVHIYQKDDGLSQMNFLK